MKAKPSLFSACFLFCILLFSIFFMEFTSSASSSATVGYDPWLDFDDDGDIDIFEIVDLAGRYGTSGEPLLGKAAIEYDSGWVNVADMNGQYFNVTHNLGSTEAIVDVVGKQTLTSPEHKLFYGTTLLVRGVGFNQTYGGTNFDQAYSVVQTADGGYALAGYTYSFGVSSYDFWLVKTDANGVVVWDQTYGGTDAEYCYSVIQVADGGYVLAGYTKSFGAGNQDFWLVKTDANGGMVWNQTYGGTDWDSAQSVVQTADGGYAVTGNTWSFGAGNQDFWLVKTDANGGMVWNQTYGGTDYEYVNSVVQTADGGYALAGYTYSFGIGSYDFWLVKTDANGVVMWSQTYGGINWDLAHSVVQTADGGYAIAGYTESFGAGDQDFWLVKTDADGNMVWTQIYGGIDCEAAYSVVQTADGGYVLAGYAKSFGAGNHDFWLVKTDAGGNMQWGQTYGGTNTEAAWTVVNTADGGYALAGNTWSFGSGGSDFWLVKTDADGNTGESELGFSVGLSMAGFTETIITFYRGSADTHWNYLKVRIWKIRETP